MIIKPHGSQGGGVAICVLLLVVTITGKGYWHLVGRGQAYQIVNDAGHSLKNQFLRTKTILPIHTKYFCPLLIHTDFSRNVTTVSTEGRLYCFVSNITKSSPLLENKVTNGNTAHGTRVVKTLFQFASITALDRCLPTVIVVWQHPQIKIYSFITTILLLFYSQVMFFEITCCQVQVFIICDLLHQYGYLGCYEILL